MDAMSMMALYAGPEDFFKVLRSLLVNDRHLLSLKAVDGSFAPQLMTSLKASRTKFLSHPRWNLLMGGFLPYRLKMDHGLGGVLATEDTEEEGWRRKGCMSWCGSMNFLG